MSSPASRHSPNRSGQRNSVQSVIRQESDRVLPWPAAEHRCQRARICTASEAQRSPPPGLAARSVGGLLAYLLTGVTSLLELKSKKV
jgi:hypothetical protein